MKYWRGYVIAAVLAVLTWALTQFAQAHSTLVDMVYPYVTRLIQTALAQWSAGVDSCLWQILFLFLAAGLLASIVLMIILRWNPVQWFGWVLAVVSLFSFLNTGLYGLNAYAGSVADDVRLSVEEGYAPSELADAAAYFRDKANNLSSQVNRDDAHKLMLPDFDVLAKLATEAYDTLTYDYTLSIYAGSDIPVKALGWNNYFTKQGITGVTCALTGEAAVNPQVPGVGLPFAICHEMAHRVCIYNDEDADFSAFLACEVSESALFQYTGYAFAYQACLNALLSSSDSAQRTAAATIESGASSYLRADLQEYAAFAQKQTKTQAAADEETPRATFADMLANWYVQKIVLPLHIEEEVQFDPLDETQVDLSGLVNAG